MCHRPLQAAFCLAALHGLNAGAVENAPAVAEAQQIARAGSQASVAGPAEYFTGRVRIDPVWPASETLNASGGLVTFEPGARSAWHTHPVVLETPIEPFVVVDTAKSVHLMHCAGAVLPDCSL